MTDAPPLDRPSMGPLRSSGFFIGDLPFGPPPAALAPRSPGTRLSEDLRRTVRALSNNAEKVRPRSPLVSAQCWHEAGRLLHRKAGRLSDAWTCYSRALAVFPDHRPSLTALSELARAAEDPESRSLLLDAQIERTVSIPEKTALLTEAAAVSIKASDFTTATKRLKQAAALSDTAAVPRILLAVLAGAAPNTQQKKLRDPLLTATPDSRIARAFARHDALREDTSTEEGTPAAPFTDADAALSIPLLWIRLRTYLRRHQLEDAARTADALCRKLPEGPAYNAARRLHGTLCRIVGSATPHEPAENEDLFYQFVDALSAEDRIREDRAVKQLKRSSRSPNFRAALSLYHMIRRRRSGSPPYLSFGNADPKSPTGRALLKFLHIGAPPDPREPSVEADRLHSAAASGDMAELAEVLEHLRETTVDADARWPIKVVECAVEFDRTAPQSDRASVLPAPTDDEAHRDPLPSIVRRTERRHRRLAELALGEARSHDEPKFVAVRLAWAAYHLESLDPFESARLYTEALDCDASLLFAIKGLERTGTTGREAAALYRHAAEAAKERDHRAAALLRAGVLLTEIHAHAEAAPLWTEAADLLPREAALQRLALRAALTYPGRVAKSCINRFSDCRVQGVSPFLSGVLSLFNRPEPSTNRLEEATEEDPGDPLSRLALTEARLATGRASLVSESLFTELHAARDDREHAFFTQRLAHIDRFHRNDETSAVHFAETLLTRIPGHRPTLARLLTYYLAQQKPDDVRRILSALSLSVESPGDAAAISRLCTLSGESSRALLALMSTTPNATILEITAQESITEDEEERPALLEKITGRVPQSATYQARLADALSKIGRDDEASSAYKQALDSELTRFYALQKTAENLALRSSDQVTLDTLVNAADMWQFPPLKAEALHKTAQFAFETLNNFEKAVDLCLLAQHADPGHEEAFRLADNLLTTVVHNPEAHFSLLQVRLEAGCKPSEEVAARMKIRSLLAQQGTETQGDVDEAEREIHLAEAVAAIVGSRPKTDEGATEDSVSDWDDELAETVLSARLSEGKVEDPDLLAALGRIYLRELNLPDRAASYLEAALKIDDRHSKAISDNADILLKRGDAPAASELLGRLTHAPIPPDEKMEILLVNAGLLSDRLNNLDEAEEVLLEARKTIPTAIAPVTALIDICERKGDSESRRNRLESALADQVEAIRHRPDEVALYENVRIIAELKNEPLLVQSAARTHSALTGDTEAQLKPLWTVKGGSRFGAPGVDARICPPPLSENLRRVLTLIAPPIARKIGAAPEQSDQTVLEKTKRRDKVTAIAAKLAPTFDISPPQFRVSPTPALRIAPGPEPLVLFPRTVLDSESMGVKRFAVAASLQWIRLGLTVFLLLPGDKLSRLLAGLAYLLDKEFTSTYWSQKQIAAGAVAVTDALPEEALTAVKPFATEIRIAAETPDLHLLIGDVGHRAGLIAAGSLPAALEGLRALYGVAKGPLADLPGAGSLAAFSCSQAFIDITREIGIK